MCVLCSGSVLNIHWADRKANGTDRESLRTAGLTQHAHIRERQLRIRQANQIIGVYGLKIRDWTGSKYMLHDKKGHTAMVQDLGELWRSVEKLLGKPIDPLDPVVIGTLASQRSEEMRGD